MVLLVLFFDSSILFSPLSLDCNLNKIDENLVESIKKPSFKKSDPNKWKKIVADDDDDDDLDLVRERAASNVAAASAIKRRGDSDEDSDLDSVPRKPSDKKSSIKYDEDGDLSPVRRKPTTEEEEIMEEVRQTKRRPNKDEEAKKGNISWLILI